jgi:hypothetical protein
VGPAGFRHGDRPSNRELASPRVAPDRSAERHGGKLQTPAAPPNRHAGGEGGPSKIDLPRDGGGWVIDMDGFWRMLDVLHRRKLRACCCLNLEICDHFPEIKDAMVAVNWDYMAHGLYNIRPIYDLSEDEERAYCQDFDNGRYPANPATSFCKP